MSLESIEKNGHIVYGSLSLNKSGSKASSSLFIRKDPNVILDVGW
jgi:hypothetical protein